MSRLVLFAMNSISYLSVRRVRFCDLQFLQFVKIHKFYQMFKIHYVRTISSHKKFFTPCSTAWNNLPL